MYRNQNSEQFWHEISSYFSHSDFKLGNPQTVNGTNLMPVLLKTLNNYGKKGIEVIRFTVCKTLKEQIKKAEINYGFVILIACWLGGITGCWGRPRFFGGRWGSPWGSPCGTTSAALKSRQKLTFPDALQVQVSIVVLAVKVWFKLGCDHLKSIYSISVTFLIFNEVSLIKVFFK